MPISTTYQLYATMLPSQKGCRNVLHSPYKATHASISISVAYTRRTTERFCSFWLLFWLPSRLHTGVHVDKDVVSDMLDRSVADTDAAVDTRVHHLLLLPLQMRMRSCCRRARGWK